MVSCNTLRATKNLNSIHKICEIKKKKKTDLVVKIFENKKIKIIIFISYFNKNYGFLNLFMNEFLLNLKNPNPFDFQCLYNYDYDDQKFLNILIYYKF